MKKCLNKTPYLLGIPFQFAILLLTFGVVSFIGLGSWLTPLACLLIYIITRVVYWREPLFFLLLGAYLQTSDLFASNRETRSARPFAKELQWGQIVDDHDNRIILQNKNGSYQASYKIKGIDFLSETRLEIEPKLEAINSGFKLLSERGVTIYWDFWRTRLNFNDKFKALDHTRLPLALRLVKDEECSKSRVLNNEMFLTVLYTPKPTEQKLSRLASFFVKFEKKQPLHTPERDIERFKQLLEKFSNVMFDGLKLAALNGEQTAKYLHSCISTKTYDSLVRNLNASTNWSDILPDQPLHKGLRPILDNSCIRVVGIQSFPTELNTDLRNKLMRLKCEFKWCSQIEFLDQEKAQKFISRKKIAWANSAVRLKSVFGSLFFSGGFEDDTQKLESSMAHDCQEIIDDIRGNKYALARVNSSFMIIGENEALSIATAETILKELENKGIDSCAESLNTMQAYLSSIPGAIRMNPRQFTFTTQDLATRFLPLSSPWKGTPSQDCLFTAKGRD